MWGPRGRRRGRVMTRDTWHVTRDAWRRHDARHPGPRERRHEAEQQRERDQRHPRPRDDVLLRGVGGGPGGGAGPGPGHAALQTLEAEVQLPATQETSHLRGGERDCEVDKDFLTLYFHLLSWPIFNDATRCVETRKLTLVFVSLLGGICAATRGLADQEIFLNMSWCEDSISGFSCPRAPSTTAPVRRFYCTESATINFYCLYLFVIFKNLFDEFKQKRLWHIIEPSLFA